ncbi:MAG TPA: GNAT family N-acetyltransferase/peptidase C39 family protein [Marinagarivorans sp.]
MTSSVLVCRAEQADLDALVAIEQTCFQYDRLSRRRMKHWLSAANGLFWVAKIDGVVSGYGLVLLHKGTRHARLYSLALLPACRGKGVAKQLLNALETAAADKGRLFMRLEVAKPNEAAIGLYQQLGYRVFGEYSEYYEDAEDALRMQKRIRHPREPAQLLSAPWYRQTTEFTCGPAALMMAMAALNSHILPCRSTELDLWREATTIFMTSGHGGCHPLGLALAADSRGFSTTTFISTSEPLFVSGVRTEHKKALIADVDAEFKSKAQRANLNVHYSSLDSAALRRYVSRGDAVLVLISTYRLDNKKTPHWVLITALDEHCLYVHDPDFDEEEQSALDCQHVPIALGDFERMSSYGSDKLRAAVVVHKPAH